MEDSYTINIKVFEKEDLIVKRIHTTSNSTSINNTKRGKSSAMREIMNNEVKIIRGKRR